MTRLWGNLLSSFCLSWQETGLMTILVTSVLKKVFLIPTNFRLHKHA